MSFISFTRIDAVPVPRNKLKLSQRYVSHIQYLKKKSSRVVFHMDDHLY
jgi:hypothetical protein